MATGNDVFSLPLSLMYIFSLLFFDAIPCDDIVRRSPYIVTPRDILRMRRIYAAIYLDNVAIKVFKV